MIQFQILKSKQSLSKLSQFLVFKFLFKLWQELAVKNRKGAHPFKSLKKTNQDLSPMKIKNLFRHYHEPFIVNVILAFILHLSRDLSQRKLTRLHVRIYYSNVLPLTQSLILRKIEMVFEIYLHITSHTSNLVNINIDEACLGASSGIKLERSGKKI